MAGPAPADAKPCTPETVAAGNVRAVSDSRTLELEDGRRIGLVGLDIPGRDARTKEAARARLHKAAIRRTIRIARLGPDDRYGRVVALVYRDDEPISLQETFLRDGHARVASPIPVFACAQLLLDAERKARLSGVGIWADQDTLIPADQPQRLRQELGRYVLVEGLVLSVRVVGGLVYLNFSRRWTQGLTAIVPKRQMNTFAKAGISLESLAGQRVLVRGVLEERNGLRIDVAGAEQIEISRSDGLRNPAPRGYMIK